MAAFSWKLLPCKLHLTITGSTVSLLVYEQLYRLYFWFHSAQLFFQKCLLLQYEGQN